MNVKDYIVYETERQSGTMAEAIGMAFAYSFAVDGRDSRPTEMSARIMAGFINGQIMYRKVPAVFNQGTPALEPSLIPHAMQRLFDAITEPWDASLGYEVPSRVFTKEFLEIHPFADGNGRVASLLWNWMRGSLSDPDPMPYFFGEA